MYLASGNDDAPFHREVLGLVQKGFHLTDFGIAAGHADDVSDKNLRFCRDAERNGNQRRWCALSEHVWAPFIFEPPL